MAIAVFILMAISTAGLVTTMVVARNPHRAIPLLPIIISIVSALAALAVISQV